MTAFRILGATAGIYIFYMAFGIAQEKLHKEKYGDDRVAFHFPAFMVLVQCLANCVIGIVHMAIARGGKASRECTADALTFLPVSISYLLAMYFTNKCLEYIDMPAQLITKSIKIVPVFFSGIIFNGKHHPTREYVEIFAITGGVILYFFQRTKASPSAGHGADTPVDLMYFFGIAIACLSLFMDGYTATHQDRLREKHKPGPQHIMFYMNMWAVAFLGAATGVTGELFEGITFVFTRPDCLADLLLFGVTSALGQIFIFYTISEFGPLPLSIITTTRKFISIFVSGLIFGHVITPLQWLGASLVFGGILAHSEGKRHGKSSKDKDKDQKGV